MSRARTALAAALGSAVVLAAAACAPQSTATSTASAGASSGTGASAAAAACSTSSPDLYKQGQLTVATDSPAYAPWFDNNAPSDGKGFESAVAYAVAAKLGFGKSQVKWVVEPFDNSYAPGAKNFDFDINEISITPQRAQAVDFSTGYYTADQGVLVLNNSKYAKAGSLSALKDAKIGVQVATTSYQAVQDEIKPAHAPSVYNTTNDEVNALQDGQIDAIVTDMPTVFYLSSAELSHGKILGAFGYNGSSPEQFGLLLKKGSGLTSCVDQAIAGLKSDGTLARITTQWLSASADVPELKQ
ncbi:amino acid ABC transporter substrate-binding protein [Streptacidiphilus sp. PB12-B1b]|uniref:ABC transporter substrate-binding protein n=1 Tax=Streptacidiphilus sp. PB12-B1b TaxID=2705012 RepID=UPI0015FDF748|nr:ABC transporter substrate-binding protein [Streptacidiphilus sp. PB12-B1b]QMU77432.1 amino acid ABC transporter substrate-binding protein [Streptacidiphilus sp. PB12-B1b]